MPTYEFRCPNGHTFDQFHKISDAPQTAMCPTCGAEAARAISGGAGLVFKGSGFYLTDYGKNAHRTSGPSGGEAKGEGKSESKGDAKSETKSDAPKSGGDGGSSGGASGGTSSGSTSAGGKSSGGSTPSGGGAA